MKKTLDISIVLILSFYLGALLFLLLGCRTTQALPIGELIVKDSIVYKDREVKVFVPPVLIKGDTVKIVDSIPCPDASYSRQVIGKSGRVQLSAEITKGKITVQCNVDSVLKILDSLRIVLKDKESYKATEKIVPVVQREKYVPWWVWVIVGLCIIISLLALRSII